MTWTLAGGPILMDQGGQLEALLESKHPARDRLFGRGELWQPATIPGRELLDRVAWPSLPPIGINEYQFPNGLSRYDRALVAIHGGELPALTQAAWGVEWDGNGEPPRDVKTLAAVQLKVPQDWTIPMFVLTPTRVIESETSSESIWIVPLVGMRWKYQFILHPYTETKVSDSPTWEFIVGQTMRALDLFTNHQIPTPVAPQYLIPDPEFFGSVDMPAGLVADLIAWSIGRRWAYDKTNDSWILQTSAEATTKFEELKGDDVWKERSFGGENAEMPRISSISLICRKTLDHWDDQRMNESIQGNATGTELDVTTDMVARVPTTFYREYEIAPQDPDPPPDPDPDPTTQGADGPDDIFYTGDDPDRTIVHYPNALPGQKSLGVRNVPASETAATELAEIIAQDAHDWGEKSYCLEFPSGPTEKGIEFLATGYTDFLSIRNDGSGDMPLEVHKIQSFPPNLFPRINLSQKDDIYVHRNTLANMETETTGTGTTLNAKIRDGEKTPGPYDGEPRTVVLRSYTGAFEEPPVGTSMQAYYQLATGWNVISGKPFSCADLCDCPDFLTATSESACVTQRDPCDESDPGTVSARHQPERNPDEPGPFTSGDVGSPDSSWSVFEPNDDPGFHDVPHELENEPGFDNYYRVPRDSAFHEPPQPWDYQTIAGAFDLGLYYGRIDPEPTNPLPHPTYEFSYNIYLSLGVYGLSNARSALWQIQANPDPAMQTGQPGWDDGNAPMPIRMSGSGNFFHQVTQVGLACAGGELQTLLYDTPWVFIEVSTDQGWKPVWSVKRFVYVDGAPFTQNTFFNYRFIGSLCGRDEAERLFHSGASSEAVARQLMRSKPRGKTMQMLIDEVNKRRNR